MKETIITWSITNWITVFLMVLGGSLILATATKLITKARNKDQ
jgi:hypothetical protein